MQSLVVYQSLISTSGFIPESPTGKMIADCAARIADAGFDGVGLVCNERTLPELAVPHLRDHGLGIEVQCHPRSVSDLAPVLDIAAKFGAHHVNLQPDVRPLEMAESIALLEGWQTLAENAGIDVFIETHRGRLSNDMLVMLQLLEALPNLKLNGDLSHYVVAREMRLPISPENENRLDSILDSCWSFHGRVSSAQQIQIPLSFPQSQPWIDQYMRWWGRGFASWQGRALPDASLCFLCEIGPPPYAITGADGEEFSDRWNEAKTMMALVRGLWQETDGSLQ